MNDADLIRLKWINIKGRHILFTRMKTENTRKHNVRQIVVPISTNLRKLIDKIGVRTSPFVLGILEEGYDYNEKHNQEWEEERKKPS